MSEHHRARFLAGELFEGRRHQVAGTAEAFSLAETSGLNHRYASVSRLRALRDHDDAEVRTPGVARRDPFGHPLDVVRELGQEDHIGAPADAGVQRDPASVASHHLDDHDSPVRLGRRVQAIDRVGRERDGGIESEAVRRADDVVVDGLRHADDWNAEKAEPVREAQGTVPADHHEAPQAHVVEHLDDAVGVRLFDALGGRDPSDEGITRVDGTQDGAAPAQDAGDVPGVQDAASIELEQTVKAVFHPEDVDVGIAARLDDGTDDRVQARGVAPAGEDADFPDGLRHGECGRSDGARSTRRRG